MLLREIIGTGAGMLKFEVVYGKHNDKRIVAGINQQEVENWVWNHLGRVKSIKQVEDTAKVGRLD